MRSSFINMVLHKCISSSDKSLYFGSCCSANFILSRKRLQRNYSFFACSIILVGISYAKCHILKSCGYCENLDFHFPHISRKIIQRSWLISRIESPFRENKPCTKHEFSDIISFFAKIEKKS